MNRGLVLALATIALLIVAVTYNTRSMIQNNIDPSIEKAIRKHGYAVVYTAHFTDEDNCIYRFGDLCINKYNVTSMDQVHELRKKYMTIWAYYTSDGEELKAKISVHSIQALKTTTGYIDAKFKTGLKPRPPSNNTVVIIDTGIDYTHPDLPKPVYYVSTAFNRVIEASNENVAQIDNECYNQTQHYCFYDEHGHGTFTVGIIAGNGYIKGITPNAKILVVKSFIAETTTVDSILLALEWIYYNGEKYNVTVVNGSWGIPGATTGTDPISLAIDKLYVDKRILTVVSAGNGGLVPHSIEIPSGARYVISVGAFDPINWKPAEFTSCGSTTNNLVRPDVCAPGVSIISTLPGGYYGVGSGTSFSAPIITAVVSTLNTRDRSEIESILSRQVVYRISFNKDNICGWGSI